MTINDPPAGDASSQSDRTPIQSGDLSRERSICEFRQYEYLPDSGELRLSFDPEQTKPLKAVISALAVALDTDPLDLDPIYYAIDTNALNALVSADGAGDVEAALAFSYEQLEVEVCRSGHLSVRATST